MHVCAHRTTPLTIILTDQLNSKLTIMHGTMRQIIKESARHINRYDKKNGQQADAAKRAGPSGIKNGAQRNKQVRHGVPFLVE
jgi:hypothetical protein